MMGWLLGIPILMITAITAIKVSFIFGTLNSAERDEVLRKMKDILNLLNENLIEKSNDLFSITCQWLSVKYKYVCSKLKRQKRVVIGNFECRNEK